MRKRVNLKQLVGGIAFALALGVTLFVSAPPAAACKQNEKPEGNNCTAVCAEGQIYVTIAIDGENHCVNNPSCSDNSCIATNPIFTVFIIFIRIASAGVGIAVVGGIVFGGIMYITARDNASQVQKAIGIILNALLALLVYIFMFAIINFLIPGGIFT